MRNSSLRQLRGPIVVLVVLQLGLGLLLAQLYLSAHHTLYNNGHWTSTKTTLEEGVMGAYSFLFSLQPMAGGVVNLGAWHGYQEIVLDREVDPARVEFDFFLAPRSYLTFEFNRAGKRFRGIRVSTDRRFKPAVLLATEDGRFQAKRRFGKLRQVKREQWHTLAVELGDESFTIYLDGEPQHRFDAQIERPQRIGFRGGKKLALVDNVKVVSRDGSVFTETFERPRSWPVVLALALAGVLAVSWGLFFLLRRLLPASAKILLFFFLMFTALLALFAGTAYALSAHTKRFYPDASEKLRLEQEYWMEAEADRIFERIERGYPARPAPGTHRILFLGSSQTRGAGAAESRDTFVRRTERLLNRRAPEGTHFEVLNAGVSAYKLKEMHRDLKHRWLALEPHTVILNAANNDLGRGAEPFAEGVAEILETATAAGIQVVLVMEPNSPERGYVPALRKLHAAMAETGERYGAPAIDMHAHLAERVDTGYLWWDWVHLTSYGQRLFAEHLVDELERLGMVELTGPTTAAAR